MKKISKCDIILVICLLIGGILILINWLIEMITSKEVIILRIPGSLLVFYSSTVMTSIYASNVIVRIKEYLKQKRKEKDKRVWKFTSFLNENNNYILTKDKIMIEFYHKGVVEMYIRPVSDLRNKYPEIEELVLKEDKEVYLTKNGYGSIVVMSLDKYTKLLEEIDLARALELRFGNVKIDKVLGDTVKKIKEGTMEYLSHEEVFANARRAVDGNEKI